MLKQCKDEASFRAKEIIAAKQAKEAAANALAKCQSSLGAAKQNLPTLKNAYKEYSDLLAKRTKQRAKQHAAYLQRANDWKEAIMFLNEFTNEVKKKLAKGVSFADLSEKLLKHASKLGFIQHVVPLLAEIAQTPAEASASVPTVKHGYTYLNQGKTIKRLTTFLNKLKNQLIVDARQNDLNEQKAQKIFDEFKARITKIISKLAKDIAVTKSQIKAMKICVSSEGSILTSASNKLLRNRRLKKAAKHTCADFIKEFVEATKNRLEEIKTLHEVLKICQKRFGELPKDLVSYLEEVKGGFKRYINSTEFQKYVAYVEKHTADNVYGRALAHGARFKSRKLEGQILAKKNLRRLTGVRRTPVKAADAKPRASAKRALPRPRSPTKKALPRPRSPAKKALPRPRSPAKKALPRPRSPAKKAKRGAKRSATKKSKAAKRAAKRAAKKARSAARRKARAAKKAAKKGKGKGTKTDATRKAKAAKRAAKRKAQKAKRAAKKAAKRARKAARAKARAAKKAAKKTRTARKTPAKSTSAQKRSPRHERAVKKAKRKAAQKKRAQRRREQRARKRQAARAAKLKAQAKKF